MHWLRSSIVLSILLLSLKTLALQATPLPDLEAVRMAPALAVKPIEAGAQQRACPKDFQFDPEFKLCRGNIPGLEHEFLVPRTTSLRVACELLGLDKFCRTYKVWPQALVEKLRGPQGCPIGSGWDKEHLVCRDLDRVYGPFGWDQTDKCTQKKCGQSCASSDWGAGCLVPKSKSIAPEMPFTVGDRFWRPEWSAFMHQTILNKGSELTKKNSNLASSLQSLCPLYEDISAAQRARFWTVAMISMAYYESGFNPQTRFFEPPPLSKYSEGLFQLSEDDGGYGPSCDYQRNGRDILDPYHNMDCAVEVLNRQIALKQEFFTPGYYYYWSVLRNKIRDIRSIILSAQSQLPFCYVRQPDVHIDWFDAADNYQKDLREATFSCQTKRFDIFAVDKPQGARYLAFKRSSPSELALSLWGAKVEDQFYVFGKEQFTYVIRLQGAKRLEVYQDEKLLFKEECLRFNHS